MINVAIVGCGYWGVNYVRVFSELPASRVMVACDTSEDRLQLLHGRYQLVNTTRSLEEVLANKWIDAVVVATPTSSHFSIAQQCLLAGKHVLIEKPLTATLNESERLIETAARLGRVLMVGHTFLYNSGVRKVKQIVSDAGFGKVYYLHATRTNMGPIRHDVNAIWDLAAHDIAIFNYLLDAHPQWVSAVGARALGNGREDVGFVTLGYPQDVIANVHASWVDPNKVRELVVVGSQRRVVFDDLNNLERVRIFEKGVAPAELEADSFGEFRLLVRDGDIISPHVEASEPLRNLCQHFLDCVEQNQQPMTDGWNGLEVVRVLSAIDQSLARNGAPVEVERAAHLAEAA
jgi:predicted dehydrogenase